MVIYAEYVMNVGHIKEKTDTGFVKINYFKYTFNCFIFGVTRTLWKRFEDVLGMICSDHARWA